MTLREQLIAWLDDPSEVLRKHARNRLAMLDSGHPEPLARQPMNLPSVCPDLDIVGCACRGVWRCKGTGQRTTQEACTACQNE